MLSFHKRKEAFKEQLILIPKVKRNNKKTMRKRGNKNESIIMTDTKIISNETLPIKIHIVDRDLIENDSMIVIYTAKEGIMITEIEIRAESFTEEAINNLYKITLNKYII